MARPSKKNPKWEQKPVKMDAECIKKLLDWFKSDFTITEACSYAWISTVTYYEWIKRDKKLANEIEAAKEYCFIMAKNVVRKWLKDGKEEFALKRLKNRQNKIYNERNETDISWTVSVEWITISIDGWA